MQHEIRKPTSTFCANRKVTDGFSRTPMFSYNPEQFPYRKKIDQRQCFFAQNTDVALFILLEKIGIEFSVKVFLRDIKAQGCAGGCFVKKFFLQSQNLPNPDRQNIFYENEKIKLSVQTIADSRKITCTFAQFAGMDTLRADLVFTKTQNESLYTCSPVDEKGKTFFYESFIPNMRVNGKIQFGDKKYLLFSDFSSGYCKETNYKLPYRQKYKCLTSVCSVANAPFSLFMGSRLGDDCYGMENCYFHKGVLHKLSRIKISGTDDRIDRPWSFNAGIHAVDITFKPEFEHNAPVFAQCNKTTAVFGKLYGELNILEQPPVALADVPAQLIFTVI